MSIDSALIVRRAALPNVAELAAAIGETGVSVAFPEGFRLDNWGGGWLPVTVDGEVSGFEYYSGPISETNELPAEALENGDFILGFAASGGMSAETASLIQRTLAARWGAAGWIDGELIDPADMAKDVDVDAVAPELRALVQGSPAERAAAMEAYVAAHSPPDRPRPTSLPKALKPLITPAIIIVIFAAIYFWTVLT